MIRYESELMHHGIKNQRWGVRNGPPYPLGKAKHNMVTRGNKGTITTGKKTHYDANFADEFDRVTAPVQQRYSSDGTAVYPPIAAVIAQSEKSGKGNPYDRGKTGFDGVENEVNPDYGEEGTTNNCTFCSAAVELRSRGYDVVARRSYGGAGAGMFERWFKGAESEYCENFDEMERDIKKDGNGTSGVMQGFYGDGLGSGQGGHSLHYRNEGGEIKIIDGQSHKTYSWEEMKDHFQFANNGCVRTRLDNCEPNWVTMASDGTIGLDPHKYSDSMYKDEPRVYGVNVRQDEQDKWVQDFLDNKDNRWVFRGEAQGYVDGWYKPKKKDSLG